ncbi:sigma-70 family RNA polymerase sigma factor [Anaerosphaera multitolerans]|uniref:Sigma-70 family RNA polymerase sigma factor n=1 Tax=Anaerosphaera multitolerans TaxID=2487351 RepID=A0A437S6L6_9FIRM|nr:sigma-70 family RNA polymerase sigma factor [Anaerosphaera multitolerans]RVU54659.1 sigma-70 family RNA polymerase sigma factor [Anaerosphaera multitolerans]
MIDSKDNNRLFKLYAKDKSNIELRNEIVLNNLKLVPYAIKLNGSFKLEYHDYDELLQEGYLKLIEAVEKFDVEKGFTFSSYAVSYLKSVTRNRQDYNKDVSLDTPVKGFEDESLTMEDTIEDETVNIETDSIDRQFSMEIRKALSLNLEVEELRIIKAYYGIEMGRKDVKDIAKHYDLSINELRRIKRRAEGKLKKQDFLKKL